MTTLFTKIIDQEIPSYKIYEDDYVYAFLDIGPFQKGHTLLVPKLEVDHIIDVPEPYYSALRQAAKKLGQAIHQATGSKKISTLTLGFEVPHAHIHLIPINSEADILHREAKSFSEQEMKNIQAKIVQELEKII